MSTKQTRLVFHTLMMVMPALVTMAGLKILNPKKFTLKVTCWTKEKCFPTFQSIRGRST
jgi:hypothetical protein